MVLDDHAISERLKGILLSNKKISMVSKLAYCGLTCQACPIYLATGQKNKEEQLRMRTEIARLCTKLYGMPFESEDITDCDGCRTEGGRLFSGCTNCVMRNCARKRGFATCADCPDYACISLLAFFEKDPGAKIRLDEARRAHTGLEDVT